MDVVEIFKRIEDRIALKYLPGCIAWADKKYNNVWSEALSRVEEVLITKPDNYIDELKLYEKTCMDLITEYLGSNERWEAPEFLESIRLTPGELKEREEKFEIDADDWFNKASEAF